MLENLDEASTSRISFKLPCLELKYSGEYVTDSVGEAPVEEPGMPAPDSIQESEIVKRKTIQSGNIP